MKYYLTAAIPYVNAKPHLGHALEFVQGDVIARYHRILGDETLYLSGADENALKNVQAAEKAGKSIKEFCDFHADLFLALVKKLDIQLDVFQRASSTQHHLSSQELWKLCDANGDIYKHSYEGLYCVGCETFYAPDELNENGECFEHPGKPLEKVTEENYFFKLSKYREQLLQLIESNTIQILPESKKNEVLGFLRGEVHDFSISRSRERARNWGVEVPGDPSQMIYVWFDALNVYQSGVGFGSDEQKYKKWWPADLHVIGKGIIRFHAVYWIAMLLSAKLQLPKKIAVHGYITVGGQKMSKTLGNVIDPVEVLNKYGAEAVRYYFLREMSTTEDADFTIDRFLETYHAHLANELGNLASRTAKLCDGLGLALFDRPKEFSKKTATFINQFQLKDAMDEIWNRITLVNVGLSEKKPWELEGEKKKEVLTGVVRQLIQISFDLQPFLPQTASTLLQTFAEKEITSISPIFPKLTA